MEQDLVLESFLTWVVASFCAFLNRINDSTKKLVAKFFLAFFIASKRRKMDDNTKVTVQKIPLLTVNAGPRDAELWVKRLKEEYVALIKVITEIFLKAKLKVCANKQRSWE
jgi:hypothetical protein